MHQIHRPLGLIWSDLWREKLFHLGFLIKILMIVFLVPFLQQEWFIQFIVNWIENPTSLPWTSYLSSGGDRLAFPYGPVMFVYLLPGTLLGWLIDYLVAFEFFTGVGFRLSLLGADIIMLLLLLQIFEYHWKKVIIYYWLSPLVLFITYWHGQLDLIPVVFFIYALTLIKRQNYWALAGILLASSIAAKHSMIIGIPFIFLYLWSHNGVNKELQRFLIYFITSLFIIEVPFLLSDAFRMMVIENQEVHKLYSVFVKMEEDKVIFLTPLVYLLLLYFFWRIRRINFDLLLASMGVAFSIVILMTPSPPGWYIWLVPILTIHQSRYGIGAVALISLFSIFFIAFHLMHTSGAQIIFYEPAQFNFKLLEISSIQSIHFTLMTSLGLLIAIQVLREGVRENDYYRLGNRPLALGIAGDSGVGKSTFSSSLLSIFGKRSTIEISGDNYHNWDRSSPMWKTLTHLDPKANRLFDLVKDVRSLLSGASIQIRKYDHLIGNFLPKKISKSKNVVIVEGLHVLYSKQLHEQLDISFFIEMDKDLREYLRMKRDISERGHKKEDIQMQTRLRAMDSEKYIQPQSSRADVIFSILPINSELLENDYSINSNLKVKIIIKHGIYFNELTRVLIGICGLQVNIHSLDEKGKVILEISGDVSSEDIKLAVFMLVPHMEELFDFGTKFSPGVIGIMQIVTLMEIDEALVRRKL